MYIYTNRGNLHCQGGVVPKLRDSDLFQTSLLSMSDVILHISYYMLAIIYVYLYIYIHVYIYIYIYVYICISVRRHHQR